MKSPQHNPHQLTLHDYLIGQMEKHRDRVAQVDSVTGQTLTFSDVLRGSEALAGELQARGLRPGSIAMVIGENSVHFSWVLLGVLRAGAAAFLVNSRSHRGELEHQLSLARPGLALVSEEASRSEEVVAALRVSRCPELVWGQRPGEVTAPSNGPGLGCGGGEARLPPDVAMLLCSSGTTGLPKALMLTHANFLAALQIGRDWVLPDAVIAGLPPYCHAYGLGLLLLGLDLGAPLVAVPRFSGTAALLEALRRHRVTSLYTVPSLAASLVAHPDLRADALPALRHIMTCAATPSPRVQAELRRRLPGVRLEHSFGMSEATFFVLGGEVREDKPGSPGLPLGDMQLRIIDPDTGSEVPRGARGELCIRGPTVMKGYLENIEATRLTLDAEGWLHTGDLACVDHDGYYFIIDRIKSIFKYNGRQVSPLELEELLLGHPGVREAAVLGVPHEYGEAPLAMVVRADGHEVSEQELQDFVAERVESHKLLRGGVCFVDELPRVTNGKVKRVQLPEWLKSKRSTISL